MKHPFLSKLLLFSFFIIMLYLLYTLNYHQIFDFTYKVTFESSANGKLTAHYITAYTSDTPNHIQFAKALFEKGRFISHPLWHTTIFLIAKIFHTSYEYGALIASTFYLMLWVFLVYTLVSKFLKNTLIYEKIFVTFTICMIGPLNIPWYDPMIFQGVGSPNLWHNVTLWTVKPFALLSLFFTIQGIEKKSRKLLVYAFLASLLSIVAKPSFIIAFLPALLLFALIHKLWKEKGFLIFYSTLTLVTIGILFYQYLHTFQSNDSHIIIAPFAVWCINSPNIPLSILLGLAFPTLYTLLNTQSLLENRYILLSWLLTFISIIYYATFAQAGKFYTDGNFGWSYMISMSLLYLFSIIEFFSKINILAWYKKYILLTILIIQLTIGIVYFYAIYNGSTPYFIKFQI